MSYNNLTKLASGSVKNINDLSKQLSKSVKSHAQSADTLAKESKRIAKASNAHSKQVKALAKVKDKAVARTNLAKLANAMNQQSEQEKKPSKATYLPALAGLYAGGALARSGQRGVLDQELINKKYPEHLARARNMVSEYESDVAKAKQIHKDLADQFKNNINDRKLRWEMKRAKNNVEMLESYLTDTQDELARFANKGKGFAKDLSDAKALRAKQMAGGLGLLGLGVGTTALLRRRKKRKQEQR